RVRDQRGEGRSFDRRLGGLNAGESREHRRQGVAVGGRERSEPGVEQRGGVAVRHGRVDAGPGAEHVGERAEAALLADRDAAAREHAYPGTPALRAELVHEARLADSGGTDDVDPSAAMHAKRGEPRTDERELLHAPDEVGVRPGPIDGKTELPGERAGLV